MDHDFSLILTFVGGLAAALLFGLIARKLHLSPLVGYLLAGVVVGPYSPFRISFPASEPSLLANTLS